MTYNVILTDRAQRDLDQAYQWFAEHAPQAAIGWYNGFIRALNSLAHDPTHCPVASESRRLSIEVRQLVYGRQGSYRAIFRLRHQEVIVLHIRHTARQEAAPEEIL